jgi:hypothetical protein
MKAHGTKIRFLAAVATVALAASVAAVASMAGSSGVAQSRTLDSGDRSSPAQPAREQRSSFQLVRIRGGQCGPDTFAVLIDGQRRTILC